MSSNPQPIVKIPAVSAMRLALTVFCAVCVALSACYWLARYSLTNAARHEVEDLAKVAAVQVDAELHRSFTRADQAGTAAHLQAIRPLVAFHKATSDVIYVYTVVLVGSQAHFVLGTDYLYRVPGDDLPIDSIMQPYVGNDQALLTALREQKVTSTPEPYQEKVRSYLSGYAPIFDQAGQFVGVLGVDISAHDLELRMAKLSWGFLALLLINFLSCGLIWRANKAIAPAVPRRWQPL
jgi:sensor histidine kinase regulating citrate/malate metabolism